MEGTSLQENQQYYCLVCNSLVKFDGGTNSVKENEDICNKFCVLSCRYLNFRWNSYNRSETLTKRGFKYCSSPTSEDVDHCDNKTLLCEKCLPLADQFCSITDQWNYAGMLYNWRLKTTMELIKERIAGHHSNSNGNKICDNLNKDDIEIFRQKFSAQVCNRVFMEWPRLELKRCKAITKNGPAESIINKDFAQEQTQHSIANHDITEEANIDPFTKDSSISEEIFYSQPGVEDSSCAESKTGHNNGIIEESNKNGEFTSSLNNILPIEAEPIIILSDDDEIDVANTPCSNSIHETESSSKNNNTNKIKLQSQSTSSNVLKNRSHSACRWSTPKPYKCVVCRRHFKQLRNKQQHEKIAHGLDAIKMKSQKLKPEPKDTAERKSREIAKTKIYRYSTTPKIEGYRQENIVRSSSNSIISKEMRNHVPHKSHAQPKKTQIPETQTDQKSVTKDDRPRRHKCTRCGKGFPRVGKRNHHEERCDNIRHKEMIRLAKTKARLIRLEEKLNREAAKKCEATAKKMKIDAEIKDKPFSCEFCGHRFSTDEDRVSHQGLHTWERVGNGFQQTVNTEFIKKLY